MLGLQTTAKDPLASLAPGGLPNHLAVAAQAHAQQHRVTESLFDATVKNETNFASSYPNCSPRSPTTRPTESAGKLDTIITILLKCSKKYFWVNLEKGRIQSFFKIVKFAKLLEMHTTVETYKSLPYFFQKNRNDL